MNLAAKLRKNLDNPHKHHIGDNTDPQPKRNEKNKDTRRHIGTETNNYKAVLQNISESDEKDNKSN